MLAFVEELRIVEPNCLSRSFCIAIMCLQFPAFPELRVGRFHSRMLFPVRYKPALPFRRRPLLLKGNAFIQWILRSVTKRMPLLWQGFPSHFLEHFVAGSNQSTH